MRINTQFKMNSIKPSNIVFSSQTLQKQVPKTTMSSQSGEMSLKRMLETANRAQKQPFSMQQPGNSIVTATLSYSDRLRAQRQNARDASLEKKKLKYQFKDISSQIIRSKTSLAARQAVGQAKRELLRLKQEKRSGKYDPEEIEAAIEHAKAMERVAKKKVRHLEEEEMAKASGGAGAAVLVEERENGSDTEFNVDDLKENEEIRDTAADEDFIDESEEYMLEEMSEDMQDMMEEMSEGLQDMLEEMGFGELSDSLEAAGGDMDPEDLKMLKIKHRNKEMKEIAKADSEYLKAVFEMLEKQKSGGPAISVMTGSGAVGAVQGAMAPGIVAEANVNMPSIDISL